METRQRRSFTDDYKRQAVDLVASSGRSIGSVAKELGLRDSVLRRWVELRAAGREPTEAAHRGGASPAQPTRGRFTSDIDGRQGLSPARSFRPAGGLQTARGVWGSVWTGGLKRSEGGSKGRSEGLIPARSAASAATAGRRSRP
ncbi:hypothetical protein DB459_20470 [Bradyrhizobium sp. WD16]|nr:hypothetical protein DB459_20470 [Bradyrhizobium sp. WD16]